MLNLCCLRAHANRGTDPCAGSMTKGWASLSLSVPLVPLAARSELTEQTRRAGSEHCTEQPSPAQPPGWPSQRMQKPPFYVTRKKLLHNHQSHSSFRVLIEISMPSRSLYSWFLAGFSFFINTPLFILNYRCCKSRAVPWDSRERCNFKESTTKCFKYCFQYYFNIYLLTT